jgi:hypothetical protein
LRLAASAGVTLLVSWAFLVLERRPLNSLGLRPGGRWLREFAAGAAGGLLLMGVLALAVRGAGGFHWVRDPGGSGALMAGAGFFLAVAFREELLFRGYAFQRGLEGLGAWPALGLMALAFAWAHGGNPGMEGPVRPWAIANIGLAGLLLGLGYVRTRSLALPVGLHLGWNWTQGSLLGFGVSGFSTGSLLRPVFRDRPEWLTGGAFGLEASLPCTVLLLLAVAGLAVWRPRA